VYIINKAITHGNFILYKITMCNSFGFTEKDSICKKRNLILSLIYAIPAAAYEIIYKAIMYCKYYAL